MSWPCTECTYLNPSDQNTCEMCETGYRLFSAPLSDSNLNNMSENSRISANGNDTAGSTRRRSNAPVRDGPSASCANGSVMDTSTRRSADLNELPRSQPSTSREEMYIREDGYILYGKGAVDERKRSIARRKALDLQKLWKSSSGKPPNPGKHSTDSKFSTRLLKNAHEKAAASCFASKSKGHFNALNANAIGAHASATATAEAASASALNVNATGANASAAASANAVRANVGNLNATGVNVSASATADAVKVAAGNVSVVGAEAAVSASASLAKVNVGNVSVTGASAGASASVNGTGVSAFNVAVSGPSAAASINVDGSLSFGNVSLGLRPSLDIGFGLNLGIPFLSGSGGSSGGQNGGNAGEGNNSSEQPGGFERYQQYLSQRFPNQRHYLRAAEFDIVPNTSGQAIDPTLTDKRIPRTDADNDRVKAAVDRHEELGSQGQQFIGFKGGPKRDADGNLVNPPDSNAASAPPPSGNPEWAGMYTSPSPDVAAGYAMDEQGNPGQIDRVYLPRDAADSYHTDVGLNTRMGLQALRDVREHSDGRYIFSGPQHDTQPDLRAPETVIAPAVRDEAFQSGTMQFVPSAHEINGRSCRLNEIHNRELEASRMVPDYLVQMTKGPDDCARDGGRERLAHTFDGRPPYLYETQPPKKPEPTEDEKLLMEECRKLGMDIPPVELEDWTKNLRNNEEYEREEDERMRRMQNASNGADSSAKSKKEEEDDEAESDKPPEPCKDHPPHIHCMKCLQRTSGARVRNIHGRIHGFQFK